MALTQTAFDLLLARLHPDRERAAEEYESIRRTLIKYFEWQGFTNAEASADKTIDRVAKKIDQGEQIQNVAKYFSGVARLIAYEVFRERERQIHLSRQLAYEPTVAPKEENEEDQARRVCMETCLRELSPENLELITRYCQPKNKAENKKNLAEEMGMPLNTLRIRVHRIRQGLRKCYAACLKREPGHETI